MSGPDKEVPAEIEADINALLDGELDEQSAAALKSAAAENGALAQAIIDAWQLQRNMDLLQLEKAPSSLSQKLKRIPREHRTEKRPVIDFSRWALVGGLASVLLVVTVMMMSEPLSPPGVEPSQASVDAKSDEARSQQARRELEIAFSYFDKVGLRLGQQIQGVLNEEISAPVKDNFSKYMPYTGSSKKEKHV